MLQVTIFNSPNWLVISFLDGPLKLAEDNEFIYHFWLSVLCPACTQYNSILEWVVLKLSDQSNVTQESHLKMTIQRWHYVPVSQSSRTQIGEDEGLEQFLSSGTNNSHRVCCSSSKWTEKIFYFRICGNFTKVNFMYFNNLKSHKKQYSHRRGLRCTEEQTALTQLLEKLSTVHLSPNPRSTVSCLDKLRTTYLTTLWLFPQP